MGNRQNAFETTLTAEYGPTALIAAVTSKGNLTSPCYLVLAPDDDAQREVIYFDGVFGASSFATTNVANRYLEGSAQTSGLTHATGTVVRSVPVTQEIDDLWVAVQGVDHGDLSGLSDNDHPQYLLSSQFTKANIDAMNIDADTLDSLDSTAFSQSDHNHTGVYVPVSHINSRTEHPLVTTSADGFMSAADKVTLDALESASGGGVSSVVAGGGIDTSGTAVVTVSHEDTSSQGSSNNSGATVIQSVGLDTYGHVGSLGTKTLTYTDVGAEAAGHNHTGTYAPYSHISSGDHDGRYYTENEVNGLLNAKASLSGADFTGAISTDSTLAADGGVYSQGGAWLNYESGYVKLKKGATEVFSANPSTDEVYIRSIPHSNVQYNVRCIDSGSGGRRLYYYDDSSTERAKHDIAPSVLTGGECLEWDMYQFRKNAEGENGPIHQWTIAERIQEKSGDDFIVRDDEGLVQNTDDRAMMADMILTIQSLHARIEELEAAR